MENEEIQPSPVIHYIAYSFLTLALGIAAYFYYVEAYLKPIPQQKVIQANAFGDLPSSVQANYVVKSSYKNLEEKLNDALRQKQTLSNENAELKVQLHQSEEKIKEVQTTPVEAVQEEVVVANEETTHDEPTPPLINEITGKTIVRVKEIGKCYDMEVGSYSITKSCKKNIINFIDKHKNAQYFEIIGLVDETEFTLYKKLEANNFIYAPLGVNQHAINNMKKFTQFGLAKYRAMEANWVIKVHTKRKAKVYNATYNLLSKDGKKGVVIRAYE